MNRERARLGEVEHTFRTVHLEKIVLLRPGQRAATPAPARSGETGDRCESVTFAAGQTLWFVHTDVPQMDDPGAAVRILDSVEFPQQ